MVHDLQRGNSLAVYCRIIFLFALISAPLPAHSEHILKSETLEDGVEHWYLPDTPDKKSYLTKKFEEIYDIIISGKDPQPFGKSIAFLVGVGKYKFLRPQLPSVENDLVKMRDFLKLAGFDEIYIAKEEIVNRDLIEKYIKGYLSGRMSENDRLLFYYSGHGADGQGSTGYMQFGMAQNKAFYGPNVLAINNLDDWGKELRINHILFILDCCASGLAFTAKSSKDESDQLLLQTLSGNGSRTVITAGTAEEKTYAMKSREKSGNGVFTKALLNAFESRSISRPNTGLITISAIYAEIEKEMAQFRAAYGKSTTPRMWKLQETDYRGTFVFLNPQAKSVALTNQQSDALGLVSKGSNLKPVSVGEGIIEIFSTYGGRLLIDGQEKGILLAKQTRTFERQPVGEHKVEIKGSKIEDKEVVVENGSIAYISFGLRSPIDESGSQPVGKLKVESLEQLSGDVYIDNYKVGVLKENDKIIISNLVVGIRQYCIRGFNQSVNGEVEIRPDKTTYISVRPLPPMNLRIVQ